MTNFRVSVCAGQGFRISPIVRRYRKVDRVWFPDVSVFSDTPSMYPYKRYVPEYEYGGEG